MWRLNHPRFLKTIFPLTSGFSRGGFSYSGFGNLSGAETSITWTNNFAGKNSSTFNGSSSKISIGNVFNSIKSISFWVKPNSLTEKILELNGSVNVDVTSGTIAATGFTSPTIYVDALITTTLSNTLWHFITVTSTTAVNASAVNLGVIGASFGNIQLFLLRFYSEVLTGQEILQLYHQERNPAI